MARFAREKFDPSREFVVAREFTYSGQRFIPTPKPIDKAVFTLRRLRQLYEMRNLNHADGTQVVATPEPTPLRPKVERYRPRRLVAA